MKEVNSKVTKKTITKKTRKVASNKNIFTNTSASLRTISGILILITASLLPILYFQENILGLQAVKLSFFYITTAFAAIFYLGSFIFEKKKKLLLTFDILSCSLILALITYIIAGFFSQNIFTSFWGRDFSIDSVLSVLFYFMFGYVAFLHCVKQKTYLAKIIFSLLVTSVISSIFHIAIIGLQLFGVNFNIGIAESLVGAWANLAIYNFIIICITLFLVAQQKIQKQVKIAVWLVFALNAISLVLVSPEIIWMQLIVTSFLIIIFFLLTKRKLHFAALGMMILGIGMLLTGNAISSYIASNTYVSSEARLGLQETLVVAQKTLQENPVFGAGPSQFENKLPALFNEVLVTNSYWGTDFRYGYSYLLTLPTTVGIVGTIPWIAIPLGVLFMLILFYVRRLYVNSYQHTVVFCSVLVMLNLYVSLLTYIPSTTILVLNALVLAIVLAFGYQEKLILSKQVDISSNKVSNLSAMAVSVICIVVLVLFFVESTQKTYAEYLFQKSRITLLNDITEKNIVTSAELVNKAANVYSVDTYYRSRALLLERQLELIVLSEDGDRTDEVSAIIGEINSLYTQSLEFDRNNYYTYVDIGNFYRSLMILSEGEVSERSYEEAKKSYSFALSLKPDYPPILLEIAKMEFIRNDVLQVRAILDEMLKTRPDYLNGVIYNIQFERSRGNTTIAKRLLNNAINFNPNNADAIILLADEQLNQGEIDGAIRTLKKLDSIGFDSASVLLEISSILESQSRFDDAIDILEKSQSINGQNEEVQARIISLEKKKSGN
jgi:tetratricopeptide (TPR) repeat protein